MNIPPLESIKSQDQARQLAIEWQLWQANQPLDYSELLEWNDLFAYLARTFNLTEEFQENGVL